MVSKLKIDYSRRRIDAQRVIFSFNEAIKDLEPRVMKISKPGLIDRQVYLLEDEHQVQIFLQKKQAIDRKIKVINSHSSEKHNLGNMLSMPQIFENVTKIKLINYFGIAEYRLISREEIISISDKAKIKKFRDRGFYYSVHYPNRTTKLQICFSDGRKKTIAFRQNIVCINTTRRISSSGFITSPKVKTNKDTHLFVYKHYEYKRASDLLKVIRYTDLNIISHLKSWGFDVEPGYSNPDEYISIFSFKKNQRLIKFIFNNNTIIVEYKIGNYSISHENLLNSVKKWHVTHQSKTQSLSSHYNSLLKDIQQHLQGFVDKSMDYKTFKSYCLSIQ